MTKKRKNKLIICEECNQWVAMVIYKYTYYCADCALLNEKISTGKLIEDANLSRKIQ